MASQHYTVMKFTHAEGYGRTQLVDQNYNRYKFVLYRATYS